MVEQKDQTRRRHTGQTAKKRRKRRIILLVALQLLFLTFAGCGVYAWQLLHKIDFEEEILTEEAGINTDISDDTLGAMNSFRNIAIFGVDNRKSGNYRGGNADTIMIVSMDTKTKDVKIVSVFRDTLLCIGDGKYRKANASYAVGGAKEAVKMLNSNLDLNITDYICVDWKALIECVDALGGIDLTLTEAEVRQINEYYLLEIDEAFGNKSTRLTQASGKMTLDGAQTLAYTRIRKLSGDDFKRTSRQRIVLEAMLNKAKAADVGTVLNICNAVFPDVSTTLSLSEILGLAKDVRSYHIASTSGFPFRLTAVTLAKTGDTVIPVELDNNVIELHRYLFENEEFTLSQTVQDHSDEIVRLSGVDDTCKNIVDMSKYNETAGTDGTNQQQKDEENKNESENSGDDPLHESEIPSAPPETESGGQEPAEEFGTTVG